MIWNYLADVESDTSPGVRYAIKQHPETGRLGCACVSYRFAPKAAKTCKHIEAYKLGETIARNVTDGLPERVEKQKYGGEMFTFRRSIVFDSSLIR